MNGRIKREGAQGVLSLPEVGRLHIGKKQINQNGKEYPVSVDYFIPAGKYADMFRAALGEKPSTIQILFPSDDAGDVCREEYQYRDNTGALVASGDGETFRVWNGKKYVEVTTDKRPDIMEAIEKQYPTKRGGENWDIVLTMRFVIPAVRGIAGVWRFSTKGKASSVKNIRDSFDSVQEMAGTVTGCVFDLSVQFAKSNKPGDSSRYPVVSLVANNSRVQEVRTMLSEGETAKNLLIER